MRRGQVYWHRFAKPDKRRPVVVLTRTALLSHLGTVTVAAITSTVRDSPSQVALGRDDGMPRACAVNLHNVFTLDRTDLGPYVTTLPEERLTEIDGAIVFALGVGEKPARLPH